MVFDTIQRYIDDLRGIIRADLFVSVNADSADGSKIGGCPIAHFLAKHNLRTFSSPFDWLMNVHLSDVAHLLQNNGEGFFATIKEIQNDNTSLKREIQDIATSIIAPHHFPRSISIDEYYPIFIKKHRERFARLMQKLKKSKRIVFVSRRDTDIGEFENFLGEMQKIHRAEYIFVNIRHNANLADMEKHIINGGGENRIVEYCFDNTCPKGDSHPDAWLGNAKYWDKIMRDFRLPFSVVFANFWVRKSDKFKRSLIKRKNTILSILRLR